MEGREGAREGGGEGGRGDQSREGRELGRKGGREGGGEGEGGKEGGRRGRREGLFKVYFQCGEKMWLPYFNLQMDTFDLCMSFRNMCELSFIFKKNGHETQRLQPSRANQFSSMHKAN